MKRIGWSAGVLIILGAAGSSVEVQATDVKEVVAARANARAGGPTNAHDAWLLERYGALSGTPGYSRYYKYKKRKYRRQRRRALR